MNTKLVDSIRTLIEPMLVDEGFELVDVESEFQGRRRVLRLLIYKPGGVSVEDCRYVNQMIELILDVHELLSDSFILEVASPGLDRPLQTEADFRRVSGHSIVVTTNYSIAKQNQFVGIVNHVENGVVELVDASGERSHIPIADIAKAQIELKF